MEADTLTSEPPGKPNQQEEALNSNILRPFQLLQLLPWTTRGQHGVLNCKPWLGSRTRMDVILKNLDARPCQHFPGPRAKGDRQRQSGHFFFSVKVFIQFEGIHFDQRLSFPIHILSLKPPFFYEMMATTCSRGFSIVNILI